LRDATHWRRIVLLSAARMATRICFAASQRVYFGVAVAPGAGVGCCKKFTLPRVTSSFTE
ncbi:MAG: hypothetical protein QG637_434, partial [Chloroflexota bacterium]|nr:hypothetical protein [Chloroflexota bacterium]